MFSYFVRYPRESFRKLEQDLSIPQLPVCDEHRNWLQMFTVKIRAAYQPEENDGNALKIVANWTMQNIQSDGSYWHWVFYLDKWIIQVKKDSIRKMLEHSYRIAL